MTRSVQEEDNTFGQAISQQAMSVTSELENKDPETPRISADQNGELELVRLDTQDSIVTKKATD
jgi:hypothetical protein